MDLFVFAARLLRQHEEVLALRVSVLAHPEEDSTEGQVTWLCRKPGPDPCPTDPLLARAERAIGRLGPCAKIVQTLGLGRKARQLLAKVSHAEYPLAPAPDEGATGFAFQPDDEGRVCHFFLDPPAGEAAQQADAAPGAVAEDRYRLVVAGHLLHHDFSESIWLCCLCKDPDAPGGNAPLSGELLYRYLTRYSPIQMRSLPYYKARALPAVKYRFGMPKYESPVADWVARIDPSMASTTVHDIFSTSGVREWVNTFCGHEEAKQKLRETLVGRLDQLRRLFPRAIPSDQAIDGYLKGLDTLDCTAILCAIKALSAKERCWAPLLLLVKPGEVPERVWRRYAKANDVGFLLQGLNGLYDALDPTRDGLRLRFDGWSVINDGDKLSATLDIPFRDEALAQQHKERYEAIADEGVRPGDVWHSLSEPIWDLVRKDGAGITCHPSGPREINGQYELRLEFSLQLKTLG